MKLTACHTHRDIVNVDQVVSCSESARLGDAQGDEQSMQGRGDGVVDDAGAKPMNAVGCSLNQGREQVPVELDQERDDGAAGTREVISPASAYWLDQAVGAEGPQPVCGLRGVQRHPVLFLLLGPELLVAEAVGTVRERENRGQQGLLHRALWPNSGIA